MVYNKQEYTTFLLQTQGLLELIKIIYSLLNSNLGIIAMEKQVISFDELTIILKENMAIHYINEKLNQNDNYSFSIQDMLEEDFESFGIENPNEINLIALSHKIEKEISKAIIDPSNFGISTY
jgi:hypothetical protein